MILVCPMCLQAVDTDIADPFAAVGAPCIHASCPGTLRYHAVVERAIREDPDRYQLVPKNVAELFGMGAPEERQEAAEINGWVLGQPILGMDTERSPSGYTVVKSILLGNVVSDQ